MDYDLIISATPGGENVSDDLKNGGEGLDFGKVSSSSYTPLISKDENTGQKDLYIRHTGRGPIEGLAMYLTPYSDSYGGSRSSEEDFKALLELGSLSASETANNLDGRYSGLSIEQNRKLSSGPAFFKEGNPTVAVMGKGGAGSGVARAIPIRTEAIFVSGSGDDPLSSEQGRLGESGNTNLGDTAHIKMRVYMPASGARLGGLFQWDLNFIFSHLA